MQATKADHSLLTHTVTSPPLLGLSVIAAFLVSFGEIAVRIAASQETSHARQIGLGVSANFAMVGLLAILLRIALFPFTFRVCMHGGSTAWGRGGQIVWAAGIVAVLLSLTDWMGIGQRCSTGVNVAGIVTSSVCLAIVLERVARCGLVRRATVLAWLACMAGTAYASSSTWRHLGPWLIDAPTEQATGLDKPNILLVVLDTLRFDRVGVYGDSKLTPNLDRLAKESIVYTQAISTAPWTLPMHASLFTGLYPREHGVSWGNYELDDSLPVVGELLKQQGYSTFGISNNWLLNRDNGFARGFDDWLETPNEPRLTVWRLALQTGLAQRVCRWLNRPLLGEDAGSAWTNLLAENRLGAQTKRSGLFFGFINYFEAHDPYHPPREYLKRHLTQTQQGQYRRFRQRQADLCAHACGRSETFTREQIELMASLYDAEVAYQDAMLGKLLEALTRLGLLENTWIIITSDHGELFGESNMVFHTASAHYQLLHVPLVVRPPGGTSPKTIEAPIQPVDIFHKIVEIGGAALPESVTKSHVLPTENDGAEKRQLCVSETFGASITGLYVTQYRDMQTDVTGWLRWITSVYADGYLLELSDGAPTALFDVHHDPQMKRNLIPERTELIEEYLDRYRQWSGKKIAGGPT